MAPDEVEVQVLELLSKIYPNVADANLWLAAPHRELDEQAPIDLIKNGRAEVIRDMLQAALLGLPT